MDLDRAWTDFEQRQQLIDEVGNADLARGIFMGLGRQALEWLDTPIAALGGRTPRSCLQSPEGTRELCAIIARFPL